MVGEVIGIVDSLELRMAFQLPGPHQGLLLDDIHIDRLSPIVHRNPHVLQLARCQAGYLGKLPLPLMEESELLAGFDLLVGLLVADIQMRPLTDAKGYLAEEVFVEVNLREMGLDW